MHERAAGSAVNRAELRKAQRTLQLTNQKLCTSLGITEATLCNWKSGRVPVPNPAALAVRMLVKYRDDLAIWLE